MTEDADPLAVFHATTRTWFTEALETPTRVQRMAWPVLASGKSALLLAPTGSGKTLAAFLAAIDRLAFPRDKPQADAPHARGVKVLYVSPLKALAVDVDRNLRAPLVGIQTIAQRTGETIVVPEVAVRSGDTSAADRREIVRHPPEILITTPESLYLLLTSKSRSILAGVETVIIDEIHAMAATKRGVHLFLTLERLEQLRREKHPEAPPLQRIGLSATQRPLEEIARLLGGAECEAKPNSHPVPRPVEIIDASEPKRIDLRIETPVEDMAALGKPLEIQSGATSAAPQLASIWPAIYPRLVELIRGRRSTMVFVNSRRLAERLAAAINEAAGEELALAHHGSVARAKRTEIEDRLKQGTLPAIVATSSMELGIDMGAVDLVIQIEAPPSVASGLQRIGRAGHHVGATSSGVIFPKYRGDLLAASAAAERMLANQVETTRYPRNCLDIVAQQIVAMVALESQSVDQLYALIRRAAPYHELPRSSFEGVLDMLSGRYPADDFAELRPRVTWDRLAGVVSARKGAQRLAILNGGTIPDRGLYGVYLATQDGGGLRVGELDEEMVFETHAGDIFLLGASSWRVTEITHDRVLVTPAPGEPGKMPFWRGDGPGRPLEFGRAIGELTDRIANDPAEAPNYLQQQCGLDPLASGNLVRYVTDQLVATEQAPGAKTIIIESFLDELGDWRSLILSPFGSRVHAPWAIAVGAKLRAEVQSEVDFQWTDDGLTFRLPFGDRPPPVELLLPSPDEIEDLVVNEVGSSAMFAARFRENAARALLLPRRQPQRRTPLWMQRRKSAELLSVASQHEQFPILLETYRECLRDVFDVPGLKGLLGDIQKQQIRVHQVETSTPSPFAATMLFNYAANYIYQGDTPLAERRAAALALDHAQLRELLGVADYRELLDADTIDEIVLGLQRLDERRVDGPDAVHDLLLHLGDLEEEEILARCAPAAVESGAGLEWIEQLLGHRRIVRVRIAGRRALIAAEDAARLREALGVALPPGLPEAFLTAPPDPVGDLISRYARTHGPFKVGQLAARLGLGEAVVTEVLTRLAQRGRVVSGDFSPGGDGHEWCDAGVLRRLKSKSLAKVRKAIEPAAPAAYARLLGVWQGITRPRRGLDGLLDAVEQLQGAALPASDWEEHVLPARVAAYTPGDLDELCTAGEVVWRGVEALGVEDGKISLFLADQVPLLAPLSLAVPEDDPVAEQIRALLAAKGAMFFDPLATAIGGFTHDVLAALWRLVWLGHVTNDTLTPLRSLRRRRKPTSDRRDRRRASRPLGRSFRSRRAARLPGTEGRWSLIDYAPDRCTATQRAAALAEQLLKRYGVLVRGAVSRELVEGGFAALYPLLRAMEDAGRVRRGYFVEGFGGAQFALAGADELLRAKPPAAEEAVPIVLAANDPANPYGAMLKWPEGTVDAMQLQRTTGARVVLHNGELIGYLNRSGRRLVTFLGEDQADAKLRAEKLATALATIADAGTPLLVESIDGQPAGQSPLAPDLARVGFLSTLKGMLRRTRAGAEPVVEELDDELVSDGTV